MPLFALTIFCGAFLLFQLQPLMGKYLLPWFGGGPGVWTTCLLFFQTLLLGGYAYAHWLTSRLRPARQASVHVALLIVALAFLPIIPRETWKPSGSDAPILHILLLLGSTVGLPYLALSATGPLLQRWFGLLHPQASPYRLYALSNAGSLLALLSYPFVFEPWLSRTTQSWAWSGGLVVFVVLCAACAWRVRRLPDPIVAGVADPGGSEQGSPTPTSSFDRLLWFVLPAIASLLLVATTNKVSLDIAAVPFLWVLPLAIYLLSFILCFDHPRWYSRRWFSALFTAGCAATTHLLGMRTAPMLLQVIAYSTTLFAGCMVCHGELFRVRPAPARLTGYYLVIAAGGAAGSMLVALIAPLVLADFRELQIGLTLLMYFIGVICLLHKSEALAVGPAIGLALMSLAVPAVRAATDRGVAHWFVSWGQETVALYGSHLAVIAAAVLVVALALRDGWRVGTGAWRRRMCVIPLVFSMLLGAAFIQQAHRDGETVFAASRNFYGAHKLHLYGEDSGTTRFFLLSNGGITHGIQFTPKIYSNWATTYYGAASGVGRALDSLHGSRRAGFVGLGAGSLAVYGRAGDTFRFYEIDPSIVDVARRHFTYLRDSAAKIDVVLGDARLSMEAELRRGEAQQFDLLALDAFSGDAIPVHLLTREAVATYLRQLRPGGILAVHISNRHLDLRPVVEGLARHHGLRFVTITDNVDDKEWWLYTSTWMLLSADPARLEVPEIRNAAEAAPDDTAEVVDWTDGHASLFSILK